MDTIKPTLEELQFCMSDPHCIRNVCILAHVDHGKTTIADSLLATNRLVSKRLAGSLRYLDDRPDEQARGITMKSSAVSLLNLVHDEETGQNKRLLLNLVDTPGHIDFSTEVEAAVRVCDGAIILVDLVEGVCVQTRESIKNAFEEHANMILVLNKFDRLVVELNKDINEIFQIIIRIIEDCNAIVAELYQYQFTNSELDIEDTGLLFSPETGNVIFASATDGWGVTTRQIAYMFSGLVNNETVDSLNAKLWNFDCYVDSKKEIKTGAIDKEKTNLFIQFCLKTIVHIYETIVLRMEKEKVIKILEKLSITNVTRDMTHTDPKVQVRAILQAWKPISSTILLQCLKIISPPSKMDNTKVNYLLNFYRYCEDPYLHRCVENVLPYFKNCSADSSAPTIVYVSKMFCVNRKNLSQNKPKVFVPKPRRTTNIEDAMEVLQLDETKIQADKPNEDDKSKIAEENPEIVIKVVEEEIAVIAMSRVFTGTLKVGQEIFIISPSYVPNEKQISEDPEAFIMRNKFVQKETIKELYMLFGRELMLVDSVSAGNLCGIGGLEHTVLRTATLSTSLSVLPLVEHPSLDPVVRHAIEPVNPKDLPILRHGLKLLMQSDSCVQVIMQETGELVLLTAGDVHLGKCIEDLTTKFAKIEIQVSSPMVCVRETVINKLIGNNHEGITLKTSHISISVVALALPENITSILKNNFELLSMVQEHRYMSLIDIIRQADTEGIEIPSTEKIFKSDITKRALHHVKEQLKLAFESSGSFWSNFQQKIWSIGKVSGCTNVLINDTPDYNQNIFFDVNVSDKRSIFDQCVVNAFNAFCKSGPLCEEPLTNCAFIVREFKLAKHVRFDDVTPQVISSVESAFKGTFRRAFEAGEQRLMEPMYTTDIQVNTSILGKVYTVISKRHGKVLDAVGMDEQEKTFLVKAEVPVIESEGFANEIRKTTSGQANPSLKFSHYEVIDGDPFYEPVEDEDDDDEDLKIELALRASKLRKEVRRRKGLPVDDEVVIHAEKQRTLNKKK